MTEFWRRRRKNTYYNSTPQEDPLQHGRGAGPRGPRSRASRQGGGTDGGGGRSRARGQRCACRGGWRERDRSAAFGYV